jgi:H+/Na+-translocating ferredoxin:NAD+ oxidoreductase subunit B
MSNDAYKKLATVLDTLPNGFPETESGVEIKMLKKIFSPDEAELFCNLRLNFETADQVAERTGRPLEGLEEQLTTMMDKGQVFGVNLGGTMLFKMVPWAFGIYELQLPHMDRELAEMCEEYGKVFGQQFFENKPQLMQVIPIESEIKGVQEALPYEKVSNIIENSQSMMYFDCVCKKEKKLVDQPCDRPMQVCTAFAPIPGVFDNHPYGKSMTKEEAYSLLNKAEEEGLVHLTWNVQTGHFFICNCCSCCCGVLSGINELGIDASKVINSHYYAQIDPDECIACGICADERCQVNAIEESDDVYRVIPEKCIGCGLCVTTCEVEAISLIRKPEEQIDTPPSDEIAWYEKRAQLRGIDISRFT